MCVSHPVSLSLLFSLTPFPSKPPPPLPHTDTSKPIPRWSIRARRVIGPRVMGFLYRPLVTCNAIAFEIITPTNECHSFRFHTQPPPPRPRHHSLQKKITSHPPSQPPNQPFPTNILYSLLCHKSRTVLNTTEEVRGGGG